MLRSITNILDLSLKLIFPADCLACNKNMEKGCICQDCLRKLDKIKGQTWIKDIPFLSDLDQIHACWYYNSTLQALIHNMKYNNFARLGNYLGQMAAEELGENVFAGLDYLIPVPLNSIKLRERGYNQAHRISVGMGNRINLPVKIKLKRIKYTIPQKSLTREERLYNMENAFVISGSVNERKIGIVDDLLTTGATLSACANTLKAAGAAQVRAITCASPVILKRWNHAEIT